MGECRVNGVFDKLNIFLMSSRIEAAAESIQHGDTSCLLHMIAVAYYSDRIAEKMGIKKNRNELVTGALLHDYFLYDWHDGKKERRIHGFTHPGIALKNASEDFSLNSVERDIIKKHMFPLTPVPPRYTVSWIVCFVDKACSLYETFRRNTYPSMNRQLKINNAELYKKIRRQK